MIEVANHSNNSNTTINISLNPFYSGGKGRHQVIETVIIVVILAIFSFLLIKIEILWWKKWHLESVCVSNKYLNSCPLVCSIGLRALILIVQFRRLQMALNIESRLLLTCSSIGYLDKTCNYVKIKKSFYKWRHFIRYSFTCCNINFGTKWYDLQPTFDGFMMRICMDAANI